MTTSTYQIALGSKVPGGIMVELPMDNQAAIQYLIEYGIKQSLNDCIAAVKVTDADYSADNTRAIVEKRWNAILTGSVRSAGTREASDPIMTEARKLARQSFNKRDEQTRKAAMTAFRKAGVTGDDKTVIAAIVEKLAPRFKDEAARIVESRKTVIDASIDDIADWLETTGILDDSDDNDESGDNDDNQE
jgi:ribosomal protein L17